MPEFPCPAPVPVSVRIAAGSVEIFAEERGTATVDVTERGDGTESAATQIRFDGDGLAVVAPEPTGWLRRGYRDHVVIRVPTGCALSVRAVSADLRCAGRYRTATIGTASGQVYVGTVDGELDVTAMSGGIRADRVGGAAHVNSASGNVRLASAGGQVTAHTASGDIDLGDLAGSAHLITTSGGVTIGTARAGALRIRTMSGDVKAGVAAGTGVWLDLSSVSGRTRNDLPMSAEPPTGGAPLTIAVQSISGDIHVYRSTVAGTATGAPTGPAAEPVAGRPDAGHPEGATTAA